METIATKIRTRSALSTEEKQFVANVRTLPVCLLEWGVRQGVIDSVIADTDELVALTLAYQMLNDLTRSIDFALQNAERGTTAAGAIGWRERQYLPDADPLERDRAAPRAS
jgi:conjugative transfer pilus assembly protein TraH